MQDCSNSSALAMDLLQSCTKPSIWNLFWWIWLPCLSWCIWNIFVLKVAKKMLNVTCWIVLRIIKDVFTIRLIFWILFNRRLNSMKQPYMLPILYSQWRACFWPNKPKYSVSNTRRVSCKVNTIPAGAVVAHGAKASVDLVLGNSVTLWNLVLP